MNVRRYYTWESHADMYMKEIIKTTTEFESTEMKVAVPSDAIGRRLATLNYFIVVNIDNTLIGNSNEYLPELLNLMKENQKNIAFGVATGRTIESTTDYLKTHGVHPPDVIISSVGSEIYYGKGLHYGKGWETHISAKWNRDKIVDLLKEFSFLNYQDDTTQKRFKISYEMEPAKDRLAMIHECLLQNKCRYTLVYSQNRHLDILPYRASKGKAIRYLSYKWEIPLKNFLVCGGSGNDEEMLRGEPLAAVVGNYSPELEELKGQKNIYFAEKKYAGGILEAIEKYDFIEKAKE